MVRGIKNEYYRIKFKLLDYLWDMKKRKKNEERKVENRDS